MKKRWRPRIGYAVLVRLDDEVEHKGYAMRHGRDHLGIYEEVTLLDGRKVRAHPGNVRETPTGRHE